MNRSFKIVFNKARNTKIAVNEATASMQKKGTATIVAAAVAVFLSGGSFDAFASAADYAAKGVETTFPNSELSGEGKKIIGGWDIFSAQLDQTGSSSAVNPSLIFFGGNWDEAIGGSQVKQPHAAVESVIGNTTLKATEGTFEKIIGASKANNANETTLKAGNVIVELNGTTTVTSRVVGGNYLTSTGNHGAGTPAKTKSTVGTIQLRIAGGSYADVYGGSCADDYGTTITDGKPELGIESESSSLIISGGTFKGVYGGNGVIGRNSTSSIGSTIVSITADQNVTFSDNFAAGDYVAKGGSSEITGKSALTVDQGAGTVTFEKNVIGGSYINANDIGDIQKTISSTVGGGTTITIDADNVTFEDELIAGSYVRQRDGSGYENSKIVASVKSTEITINGGHFGANVIAGGKVNNTIADISSNVTGDTHLNINGGKFDKAVIGGGSAKDGNSGQKSQAVANVVGTTHINITGGEFNGVIGGGFSYLYTKWTDKEATVTANVGNTEITIGGGELSSLVHGSGLDDFTLDAAVIGGGVAYVKDIADQNYRKNVSLLAKSDTTKIVVQGENTTISSDVFAGGYARGGNSTGENAGTSAKTDVQQSDITVVGSTISGNVYGGGYAEGNAVSAVDSAELMFENAKVDGNVHTGGFAKDANAESTVNAADLSLKGTVVTQEVNLGARQSNNLNLVGTNKVGKVSGIASGISFDGTGAEGGTILEMTDPAASLDMSGAGRVVAKNIAEGTTLVDGKYKTNEDTKLVVENVFGDVVYDLSSLEGQNPDLLKLTAQGLETGIEGATISAVMTATTNSKTLSESYLGSVGFVAQGAEFVADEGMRAINEVARPDSITSFGVMTGGRSRYVTGSHVSVKGVTLAAGAAGKLGNTTLSGFVEAGWASSSSHVRGTQADGDHDYYGVGVAARYDFEQPVYLDASLRLGQVSTEYDGTFGAGSAKYDADSLYTTMHVGTGYVFDLAKDIKLDAYGRYVFSFVKGDEVSLGTGTGEAFDMDDTVTHAVRIGARLTGARQNLDWYAGLAYEHVFDGKAEGNLKFSGASAAVDAPALEGNAYIMDLGLTMKPSETSPWTIGVGLKGYAGDREGASGNLNVLYSF